MRRDPTEFRERFAAWKNGELVYEGGLPKYIGGKLPWDDSTDFITKYEGFSEKAYLKSGDVPTIGYGTTNPKWVAKGKITKDLARLAMAEDLALNEPLLRKNIKNYDKLPDTAKTVLRDILYNVGQGNMFQKSPKFMKAINSGNWEEAARQMDWDNNKPGFSKGAMRRNKARLDLFLSGFNILKVNPVAPLVLLMVQVPLFQPVEILPPEINTDYSLLNASIQSPVPQLINAWKGAESPAYGGSSFRMPTLEEYMRTGNVMPVVFK